MNSFLISTFQRVLKVTTTADGSLFDSHVIASGRGVYFGLAQAGPCLYVAERNLAINTSATSSNTLQNTIRLFLRIPMGSIIRTPIWFDSSSYDDLHQIAYERGNLFVTSRQYPFLFKQSVWSRRVQSLDLAGAVPEHLLKREVTGRDAYHFNSVSVDHNRLLVLAHNWDEPSFALVLCLKDAMKGKATLLAYYEDLGSFCHDILVAQDALWTLDSGGSALVRIDPVSGVQQRFSLKSEKGVPFPRGLGHCNGKLIVSYGFNSVERAKRMTGDAMFTQFDLEKHQFDAHHTLGPHGNTCAVLPL